MNLDNAKTLALVGGSLVLLSRLLSKGKTTQPAAAPAHSPFDLDVAILNHRNASPSSTNETATRQGTHTRKETWSNLGFWDEGQSNYGDACKEMAERVARAADIQPHDWIADIGCGWGDQCIFFSQAFSPAIIQGINIAPRQVASVMKHSAGHKNGALIQGTLASAVAVPFTPNSFDKVIALDCAYHFPPRRQFFLEAQRLLRQDGNLALTDVILPCKPTSLLARFVLWLVCRLSHIPHENMLDLDSYRSELESAGFLLTKVEYWDSHVFAGYARFIKGHAAEYSSQLSGDWATLRVTGFLLGLLDKYGVLHYCLITARKSRNQQL